MKLIQKGIVRITTPASELVGLFEAAAAQRPMGEAIILITDETGQAVLYQLSPDQTITVQWTENQKEEEHGAGRRNH